MLRAVPILCLCGCSWIFMERVPEDHHRGQRVDCSGSKGWAAWDGVLAAAHAVGFIADVVVAQDTPGEAGAVVYVIGASDLILGVAHLSSAISGSKYADECLDARLESPNVIVTVPVAATPAKATDERKTVYGASPMWCASVTPDVGLCFTDAAQCKEESAKIGAPDCEQRAAASCFNATKTLDGSKVTVCAISIKDCETRRSDFATNPDYSVTRCGIYRTKQP